MGGRIRRCCSSFAGLIQEGRSLMMWTDQAGSFSTCRLSANHGDSWNPALRHAVKQHSFLPAVEKAESNNPLSRQWLTSSQRMYRSREKPKLERKSLDRARSSLPVFLFTTRSV